MELETNNMTPGIGRESVLSTVEPVAADTSLNKELDSLVQNEQQLSVLLSQASVLDGADFYVTDDEQFSGNDFTLVAAPEFSYQSGSFGGGVSYLPDFVEPFIPFESRRRYDHSVYIYQLLADFMILLVLGVVGSRSSSRMRLDFDWCLLCARENEMSISFR